MVYHQQKLPATFQCDGSAGGLFAKKKSSEAIFHVYLQFFFAGFLPINRTSPTRRGITTAAIILNGNRRL